MDNLTIKDLIRLGSNLSLKGKYNDLDLKEFVRLASSSKNHITIDGTNVSILTLKDLARIGGIYLTIEITKN